MENWVVRVVVRVVRRAAESGGRVPGGGEGAEGSGGGMGEGASLSWEGAEGSSRAVEDSSGEEVRVDSVERVGGTCVEGAVVKISSEGDGRAGWGKELWAIWGLG